MTLGGRPPAREEDTMGLLSDRELAGLLPAETHALAGPIPTQSVSSDEFMPAPQARRQRRVEARVKELGAALAKRHGMTRRRFLATASGMAAAFLAMNEVYGALYDVNAAEAQTPGMAKERADALSKQFVMDCHTHFLRDDTRIMTFVRQRQAVGKAGWNKALADTEQTIEDLKFANYYKEVFLDSDTKVALLSGAPSDVPQDWFLTNETKADARARLNRVAGGGKAEDAWTQFEKTGRIEWVTDLAEVPSKFGVSNVYADVGQLFAQTTIADPRVSAAMMGMLVRGLGADHVVWGTDAIWTGSPQWQIEALRRLEIPEDMQKQHGFKPLGPADGPVKSTILGETNARLLQGRAARRAGHRPHRRAEGGVRAGGEPAEQPALRLRGGVAGLTGARATRIAGRGGDSVTTRPRARGAGR